MAGRTTYYEVLGVPRSATPDQIRAAYHRAARVLHPDVGGSAAAFQRVTTAYHVLVDPDRRAHYDRVLAGHEPAPTGTGGWTTGPAGTAPGRAQAPRQPPPPRAAEFPGMPVAARRRYLAMMAVSLTLFALAGAVVRQVSVPAAIAMAVVAMVIPPVAAIMANRPPPPGGAGEDRSADRVEKPGFLWFRRRGR